MKYPKLLKAMCTVFASVMTTLTAAGCGPHADVALSYVEPPANMIPWQIDTVMVFDSATDPGGRDKPVSRLRSGRS